MLRGEAWREEVATLRGDTRRDESASLRGDARRDETDSLLLDGSLDEPAPPRGDARRDDASLRHEPARRDSPRADPLPPRAEAEPRAGVRHEPPWMPPPPPSLRADDDERAGRSDITIDVSDDDGPQLGARGTPPWSFADVRRSRAAPTEPEEELIPEPPPFGSGPHPVADRPVAREDGSVVSHTADEPTRRREQARRPVEPPRDRYGWSAQAEGTPVRMGWSVQAEGEPERLSWTSADDERDRLRWPEPRPEPRPGRWSGAEGSDRWSRPRTEPERRPPPKPPIPEDARPWPPKASPRPPKAPADAPDARPPAPERPQESVRQARPPKTGWDDPPELHRDPHENDFDRRRRETAAIPSAHEVDLDNPPLAYGRDRPFDPEPPLQLDVWSAYEQLQRSRLGPDEQTEPDAPVARRGPGRADLSGAALASEEDSSRRPEAPRPAPRVETTDTDTSPEGKAAPRSLGVARRPERPAPPEPRDRGGAMLRGRAPARPTPPLPARQPDAPSLRRARRPARVRDESTSEYLAVDGSTKDPERS